MPQNENKQQGTKKQQNQDREKDRNADQKKAQPDRGQGPKKA